MREMAVVIGAGITGSFTALEMALRGAEVLLLEGGRRPSGATSSISGVLHGGARYAVANEAMAAACRDENPIMRRIASDFLLSASGFFAVADDTPDDYFERFTSSTSRLGIHLKSASISDLGSDRIRRGAVRELYETADAVVDLQELLLHVISRAVEEGVEYMNAAEVVSAEPSGEGEYALRVRRGGLTSDVRGPVVVAAGHGSPALLREVFGVGLDVGLARGSHLALRMGLGGSLQLVKPPGSGDLFAPVRGGSLVGPTLVQGADPGRISDAEASALMASASKLFDVSWDDVYGWTSTGRMTFDQSRSAAGPDLLMEPRSGLILAYAANMSCGRRVAEMAAGRAAAYMGLRGGRSTSSPGFTIEASRPEVHPGRPVA